MRREGYRRQVILKVCKECKSSVMKRRERRFRFEKCAFQPMVGVKESPKEGYR